MATIPPIVLGPIPFGIVEPKPLSGFPEGKARIRIRPDDWVVVRVRTPDSIREFYPFEEDGKWTPGIEKARNQTS